MGTSLKNLRNITDIELSFFTKITSLKNLRNITDIELSFFTKIASDKEIYHETFFHYYTQKLVLLNHFYTHWEIELKGYTDHGPEHIRRVLIIIGDMLKNNEPYIKGEDVSSDLELNIFEIYILLCSTIWHDIGNLISRRDHQKESVKWLKKFKKN